MTNNRFNPLTFDPSQGEPVRELVYELGGGLTKTARACQAQATEVQGWLRNASVPGWANRDLAQHCGVDPVCLLQLAEYKEIQKRAPGRLDLITREATGVVTEVEDFAKLSPVWVLLRLRLNGVTAVGQHLPDELQVGRGALQAWGERDNIPRWAWLKLCNAADWHPSILWRYAEFKGRKKQ